MTPNLDNPRAVATDVDPATEEAWERLIADWQREREPYLEAIHEQVHEMRSEWQSLVEDTPFEGERCEEAHDLMRVLEGL